MSNNNQVKQGEDMDVEPIKKKRFSRGQNRNKYNKKREEIGRRKDNAVKMQQLAEEFRKKFFVGFADSEEGMKCMIPASREVAKVLPVSTRGIGLMTQFLYVRLAPLLPAPALWDTCSPYAVYRVTLAQLETRVYESSCQVTQRPLRTRLFTPQPTAEFRMIMQSCRVALGPLANIINACGKFKLGVKSYIPELVRDDTYRPHLTTYRNLRETVVALSTRNTPVEIRSAYYRHSSLPFAAWDGNENDPMLLNADLIIPPEYDQQHLRDDISSYTALLDRIGQKYPKYLINGSISYDGEGSEALLVSTNLGQLRNPDLVTARAGVRRVADFRGTGVPVGNHGDFYSAEQLEQQSVFIGITTLMGESDGSVDMPARLLDIQHFQYSTDWLSSLQAQFCA